jgi:hypothetical protein
MGRIPSVLQAGLLDCGCIVRWLVALLILLPFLVVPAEASRVRGLNLEEMTARADRIFNGKCVEIRVGVDPALGQTVTWVSFVPEHAVKGQVKGRITMKLLGNQSARARPGESTEGIPRFEKGEEVVLFLYPDSKHGLTSPVGFGQGAFKVVTDKSGQTTAANQFGNEGLLERLSPAAQNRLGEKASRYRGKRSVPPEDLLEMARTLGQ